MVRIWLFLCLYQLLITVMDAPTIANQQFVKTCPQMCLCTPEDPLVRVQCRDGNLKSVPYTTFDKWVSLLDVSLNDLYTLEDNTFSHYESLSYIYLEDCMLENISEKTFQHLENLILVDLSYNYLTLIPPNLFNGNHRLQTLKLRNNDLSTLQLNRNLLNGPPSLSSLDLHSCELSDLSPVTFSSLPNLTIIDISKNKLVILGFDTLSALKQLQDVNLENNPFECGPEFQTLWNAMQSNLSLLRYRTLTCQHKDGKLEIWQPKSQSSLNRPITPPSVTPPYEPDTNAITTLQPSHNPDTNNSTTPKSSMTSSNNSDASTNTTDNPTTPFEEENDTNHWLIIVYIVAAISFAVIVPFVAFEIRRRVIRYRRDRDQNANAEERLL